MCSRTIRDAVRDFYEGRWGAPARRAAFRTGPLDVEVFKWADPPAADGVTVYATVGASEHTVPGQSVTTGLNTSSA
jgi:hypothetical protein